MRILLFFCVLILLAACKKSGSTERLNEPPPTTTPVVFSSASFMTNVHPTSGTVRYAKDSSGRRYLQFEHFKTDNGPDLRVWISKGQQPTDYQELGALKAVSGSFNYLLEASADPASYPYVLIWCEDFSVLFGHAVLK